MSLVGELAYRKKYVIVAGLNMDYRGKEFGYMGGLLAMADEMTRFTLSVLFVEVNVEPIPKGC